MVGFQFNRAEFYCAAVGGVFHRIAENIHQQLAKLCLVANDAGVYAGSYLDFERMVLFVGKRLYHAYRFIKEYAQVERVAGKHGFSAFYCGKVKHVVDYLKQVFAGGLYLFKAVADACHVSDMLLRDCRHTEY